MNLHTIVAPVVGVVNVNQPVTLLQSVEFTTNADFSRTPTYLQFTMNAQIQGLQSDDIRLLNGLGIMGERRKVYLWGTWSGLVRSLQKGNDLLVFPDGSEWKVAYVFEDFGHGVSGTSGWCSIAVVLQNPISDSGYVILMTPYYLSFSMSGGFADLTPSEWDGNYELFDALLPVDVSFVTNLSAGPPPGCDIASLVPVTLTLQIIKNSVMLAPLGQISFAAGSLIGTVTSSAVTVQMGNRIRLVAPPSVDMVISGIYGIIVGAR